MVNKKSTLEQATKAREEKRCSSTLSLHSAIDRGGWNVSVTIVIMEGLLKNI
jgi:hypothetical protein